MSIPHSISSLAVVVYQLFLHCVSSKGEGLCTNNGTCFDGFCYCSYGYTGKYCGISETIFPYVCVFKFISIRVCFCMNACLFLDGYCFCQYVYFGQCMKRIHQMMSTCIPCGLLYMLTHGSSILFQQNWKYVE